MLNQYFGNRDYIWAARTALGAPVETKNPEWDVLSCLENAEL